jgi:cyclopropane fatty-acyl-phospholipid synthase-like methyltransferase
MNEQGLKEPIDSKYISPAAVCCQSCGGISPNWSPIYYDLKIYRCGFCSSLSYFTHESLDSIKLYNPGYFEGGEYRDYQGHRRAHEAGFKKKWHLIKSLLNDDPRVFEIGCAYGFFINYVMHNGASKAFGVDVNPSIISKAVSSFGTMFGNASETPRFPFNCLVAWDVWEHLEAPFSFFSEALKKLEPGGLLALTTVDSSSFVARLRGSRWRQIHPPTHIHYPTYSAMNLCMRALGLEVVHHSHFAQVRAMEMYLAALHLDFFLPQSSGIRKLPIGLNLYDIQLVIARKPMRS